MLDKGDLDALLVGGQGATLGRKLAAGDEVCNEIRR